MKKEQTIRYIVIAALFILLSVGIIVGAQTGTLCGFGIDSIAVLCPLGALLTMISSRTLIPRVVLSFVLALVALVLLGRAFCAWICPVTLWNRIKEFFRPKKKVQAEQQAIEEANRAIGEAEIAQALKRSCGSCATCAAACPSKRKAFDSRHAVLGAAVLSTAIFGFPVFCLVCPVGLSFATIVLLLGLFGLGNLNWGLIFAPAVLILELVVLKKWCTRWCPISALFNLVSRFSRTGLPEIDNAVCMETSKGIACSKCASVCKYDINLRHPEYGERGLADCSRCMDCVKACPTHAISLKLVNKRPANGKATEFTVSLPPSEV